MASFLGCKLFSVTILLLGLCINGEIRVYAYIDLEKENAESYITFRKKLLDGLEEQVKSDTFKELDNRSKQEFYGFVNEKREEFNDLVQKYAHSKGLENGNNGNAIDNGNKVITSLGKNTHDFIIKAKIEIEKSGVIDTRVKELKLASIEFSEIGVKDWTYDADGQLDWEIARHYREFENTNTYNISFEIKDDGTHNYVYKMINIYDSISLECNSAGELTTVFNEPIKRRVLIL